MKYLLTCTICAMALFTLTNCAIEPVNQDVILETSTSQQELDDLNAAVNCIGENPEVKLINNGTTTVNLEVYDVNGNLLFYKYNVDGETSFAQIAPGEITFAVSNINADKLVVLNVSLCQEYILLVDANNQLTYTVNSL